MSSKSNTDKKKMMSEIEMFNRRRFLAGASLLLGSAGIEGLIRTEVLKKAAKTLGREILPSAEAAGTNTADFFIDLRARAGMPMLMFGAPQPFTQSGGSNIVNTGINQVSDYMMVAGTGANALYMNNVTGATNALAKKLGPHAGGIALSNGMSAAGLPHTQLFSEQEGNQGMKMISPCILFAERAKKNAAYTALTVPGVNWNRAGAVMNSTGGKAELVDVNGAAQFTNLFSKPILRLADNEVSAVVTAATALSKAQASQMVNRINDVQAVAEAQAKGGELVTEDKKALVSVAGLSADFRVGSMFSSNGRSADLGGPLAYTCKAFQNGLIAVSTITLNLGDWHNFQDPSFQGAWGAYVSQTLSAAITFLKATAHPFRPGESLWDRSVLQFSTEFSRGLSEPGMDNNDGGTKAFLFAGGGVKGGFYGTCDVGSNIAYGFNPSTGAPTVGTRNSIGSIYNTANKMLGNPERVPGDPTFDCLIKV